MDLAGMNFSLGSLLAGLVFSVFGLFIFRQGKREANFRRLVIGIVLLTYSLFISNAWANWGIGTALLGINYFSPWVNEV